MKRSIILLFVMYGVQSNLNSMTVSHHDNWLESVKITNVRLVADDNNKETYSALVSDPSYNQQYSIYSYETCNCGNKTVFKAQENRMYSPARTIINPHPEKIFYFLKARSTN